MKRNVKFVDAGTEARWHQLRNPFDPDGIQGIGSSEGATATGHNKYRTPLDLWQEKVGIKEPFSGNEATERGKANEASSRAWFAMNNKWCRVDYHEFGLYISGDIPMYTTLDGEITALEDTEFHCIDPRTGRPIALKLRKGDRGILEIKDPMPQTEEAYLGWNTWPEMYAFQNAGQIRVTGFSFVIDVAHITGPFADGGEEYRCYGFLDSDLSYEIRELEEVVPVFWGYIRDKQQPPLALFDDRSMSLVEINPEVNVGTIWADIESARVGVIRYAKQFEGITFGEGELKEAKKVRAELNKYKKALNDTRIAIGKQWDAPLAEFKSKVDGLISIVDEVCIPVDKHIKEAEAALDKAKTEKIQKVIEAATAALDGTPTGVAVKAMGGIPFNDKWLNATKKMPEIEKEINACIESISSDLSALEKISDDEQMHQSLLQEYYRTRSINDALMAKERIIAARKAAEDAEARKKEQAEAARQKLEEWKSAHAQPRPEEEKPIAIKEGWERDEPADEPGKKEICITLRFYHTDAAAFRDLMQYMKENGFTYEMVR